MQDLVEKLTALLKEKDMMLAIAESCTGGLLAANVTQYAGASTIFDRGFFTYSNQAKTDMLDVPEPVIASSGAVSTQTAEAMAQGALKNSQADIAISITGIAGPDGGSDEKPVGTVCFGYAVKDSAAGSMQCRFDGDREQVRNQAVSAALKKLIKLLS